MRTFIIIGIGLCIGLALISFMPKKFQMITGVIFCLVWAGVVFWNLQLGLSHGYTLAEEAPIQLLIFIVPVVVYWGYFVFKD
ncbi:MAG: hypothetical protein RR575_11435 [Acinetobacter sp.]